MSWTDEKVQKLKELWKKGHTASQIAEMLGDTTRNAVIGKAHRLNLEAESLRNKAMLHILQQGVSVDKDGEKVYLQDVYNQEEEVREEE